MIPLNVARTNIFTLSATFIPDTEQRHKTPLHQPLSYYYLPVP